MTTKTLEPPRLSDPALLDEPMKTKAAELAKLIAAAELPMVLWETRRSIERQSYLFRLGVTQLRGPAGPHCWGLAVDWVLDVHHAHWERVHEAPRGTPSSGAAWDTGVEYDGTLCLVARSQVLAVWQRYGSFAMGLGLEWGGNAAKWRSSRKGDPLGWDPAHVQMPRWSLLRRALTGT